MSSWTCSQSVPGLMISNAACKPMEGGGARVSGVREEQGSGGSAYELHGENCLVDVLALFGEASAVADRAAPGHVGGVAVPLGACVD